MDPKPLLAVDAPSMLYRAFFALPKTIKGADGTPVNALLGAANLILREVDANDPRAVVLCFGPDAAAYRVELLDAYHAERPEMPDELAHQWGQARDRSSRLSTGWSPSTTRSRPTTCSDRSREAETEAGGESLILTGDRDLYQCASESVTVLYVKTGGKGAERVDPAEVEARYGIPPRLVPDFIALRGDPSDGIPGAKGVGAEDRRRAVAPCTGRSRACSSTRSARPGRLFAPRCSAPRTSCSSSRTSPPSATPGSSARGTPRPTAAVAPRPPARSA